ncbi:MAG: DUF308 domain-containing protein [Alphaproteobacteria bacterium]|nr:DUF308 domain-containing protein [Alphaproteobacteria bacterium]
MVEVTIQKEKPKRYRCCAGFWHAVAGALMVLIGLFLWFNPAVSLIALALYLGAALIIVGAGYVSSSLEADNGWWTFVGVLDILIGLVLVFNMGITAATLPIIFAIWCLAVGAAQIVSAYKFGRADLPWGWSMALGVLGVVFGFVIVEYPLIGTIAISTLMGLYMVVYGVFEISEYLYFRKLEHPKSE